MNTEIINLIILHSKLPLLAGKIKQWVLLLISITFQTIIPFGIKNINQWRPVRQRPENVEPKNKKADPGGDPSKAWFGLGIFLKPRTRDP